MIHFRNIARNSNAVHSLLIVKSVKMFEKIIKSIEIINKKCQKANFVKKCKNYEKFKLKAVSVCDQSVSDKVTYVCGHLKDVPENYNSEKYFR